MPSTFDLSERVQYLQELMKLMQEFGVVELKDSDVQIVMPPKPPKPVASQEPRRENLDDLLFYST